MAEQDALKTYKFPKTNSLFVNFEDGDEYKLRVLTTDPVVTTREFEGDNGETNISTKFAFIVYNFTLGRAQILNAGATITKEIQRLHQDEDFGANIKNIDIKISATGTKLTRKYSVQVLPKTEKLTQEQVKECAAIKLDEIVKGDRMSFYKPPEEKTVQVEPEEPEPEITDKEVEEPINLDDIPF